MPDQLSPSLSPISPAEALTFWGRTRWLWLAAVCAVLLAGLGLRLVDLTDPPLDYHPTRQLRSAIIARAMYYQMAPQIDAGERQQAVEVWQFLEVLEPPIFERLVAVTYRLVGREQVWVASIYSALFWLVGGLALFDLARRLAGVDGALGALTYFMLTPFAVITSRTFMPDPLMVMWILLAGWALYRWLENPSWRWTWAAGGITAVALLVKVTAAFPLGPLMLVAILSKYGWRFYRERKVWALLATALALPGAYYLGLIGGRSTGYFQFWMLSFSGLLLQPRFYVLWLKMIHNLMNLALVVAALIGVTLLPKTSQRLYVLALMGGYLLYGLFFPYQIHTHEYYSLMFVPGVALGLAPLAGLLFSKAAGQRPVWQLFTLAVLGVGLAYPAWITYTGIAGVNNRPEAAGWIKLGQELPEDGNIIALTHDYGMRILYYGNRVIDTWPTADDFAVQDLRDGSDAGFEALFEEKTSGKDYFLVTLFSELDQQPELKAHLYDHYPVYREGGGYILFDLQP